MMVASFSVFRSKLSRIFNACIGTRKCKEECTHEYKYVSKD